MTSLFRQRACAGFSRMAAGALLSVSALFSASLAQNSVGDDAQPAAPAAQIVTLDEAMAIALEAAPSLAANCSSLAKTTFAPAR